MNRLNQIVIGAFFVMFVIGAIHFSVPAAWAAEEASVYPLKAGQKITYRDPAGGDGYSETCELKKIKNKNDVLLHEFSYHSEIDGVTFAGDFVLDATGGFHECSGMIRRKSEPDMMLRFSASRKNLDIKISSAWKDETGRGPKSNYILNGIPEDTWILMDGAVSMAMYLGLEPLTADYNVIHQFLILNPFSEERRAGKMRVQVTGEETVEIGGQAVPVYAVTVDVPKYMLTMKAEDQDHVGTIQIKVSKTDKKVLKFESTDLDLNCVLSQ